LLEQSVSLEEKERLMKRNVRWKFIVASLILLFSVSLGDGSYAMTANDKTNDHEQIEPKIVLLHVLGLLDLYPIVGLVFDTHSARLNVTLIEVLPPGSSPPERDDPVPVELLIFDVEGRVLARSTDRLTPDRTTSLRLNQETASAPGEPVLIRAVVKTGRLRRRHKILSSFEVVENATQQTKLVMKGEQFLLEARD
jgi:hypothetical protein